MTSARMIFSASACQPVSFFAQSSTLVPRSGLTFFVVEALVFFGAAAFFFVFFGAADFSFAAAFFLAVFFFALLFFFVAMDARVEGPRQGSRLRRR